jgi:hypothetical protein
MLTDVIFVFSAAIGTAYTQTRQSRINAGLAIFLHTVKTFIKLICFETPHFFINPLLITHSFLRKGFRFIFHIDYIV